MFKREKGTSFFNMLIVLMMVGSLFAIAFKIYPPYLDHVTIKAVVEGVANDYDELRKPVAAIKGNIYTRLNINQVTLPDQNALSIVNNKGVLLFDLQYEVRLPMFFNVDAVVKFSESYEAVIP
ncbi:DUF4845 domain-containing protein [Neptunomonas sp.]|uniref:DUF4845 domain-containing protein n=1 Tax=Neptunomonas sp. TaxID=1971898 RepID=UPI0025E357EF|nr:DUF4845 domain-containing protein [Neptunomonas sp.]